MNTRTIKECLCDSTEKVETAENLKVLPICLGWFLRNMAVILLEDAATRLSLDAPTAEIDGQRIGGGRAKVWPPTPSDLVNVLNQNDLFRGMAQYMQLQGFLAWLLDEKEPTGNGEFCWYDLSFLGEKWNEFARKERELTHGPAE